MEKRPEIRKACLKLLASGVTARDGRLWRGKDMIGIVEADPMAREATLIY